MHLSISHIHKIRQPAEAVVAEAVVVVATTEATTIVHSFLFLSHNVHRCVPSRQVVRQHCHPSISGSPPIAMHRLCVTVYVASVLHPHECIHRMWLLYLFRIYTEARPEPPPRRVLLMHHMPALSHGSYLHLLRSPSRHVIPPSLYSIAHGSVRWHLSLHLRSPVSLTSIYFDRPSPCNL